MQLIECVPNFSEGRDMSIIQSITDQIESVEGVKLLDVDPGKATNRTVVTFVGEPKAVIQAAFLAIKRAGELIDMSKHCGEHPRMGATDVCPLIPISGITMEETAQYAHQLAKRVGEELNIPCYMYEAAATQPNRKNLAIIRAGEYEGLAEKLKKPEWQPDFGPAVFNAKSGFDKDVLRNLENSGVDFLHGTSLESGVCLYWVDEKAKLRDLKMAVGSKNIFKYRPQFYTTVEEMIEAQPDLNEIPSLPTLEEHQ